MSQMTPFGILNYPEDSNTEKVNAVLRALDWCQSILEGSLWVPIINGNHTSLTRTINQHTIEVFPIEGAYLDLGMNSRFKKHHVPIHLNNNIACIQSTNRKSSPLHTDMVASVILLFGQENFNPQLVPQTLHSLLTDEQRASLPKPPHIRRYVPGQPSTSGREFLPEHRVIEMFHQHPDSPFQVQFEKRDGTLRNMIARLNFEKVDAGEQIDIQAGHGLRFNPLDYHLQSVTDMVLQEFRLLATDRITEITIAHQTYQTSSAEEMN